MSKKQITDEQIIEAIKKSYNIISTLIELDMVPCGGNYSTIKKCIQRHSVDASHFIKPGFKKGHKALNELTSEEIFKKNSNYSQSKLKKYILQKNLLPYLCFECGIKEWRGKSISLHLHHINGNNRDNRLENLCFICPNCHSQTHNYCGRALKKPPKRCLKCGKKILKQSAHCRKCENKLRLGANTKISWPSLEELISMIKDSSCVAVAKQLGVSDKAIVKHIKKRTT